jgi:hypothetical protein
MAVKSALSTLRRIGVSCWPRSAHCVSAIAWRRWNSGCGRGGARENRRGRAPVLRSRDVFALAMGNLTRFKSGM